MATVQEMMQDAANSVETAYMMSAGDTFEGSLSDKFDEDWIRIEMSAGMLYTINLSGDNDRDADNADSGVADTFLRLYDSKGGLIKQNDDVDGAMGDLSSSFQFIPEVDGTYYISAGAYTGNPVPDNDGDYKVTVTAMEVDPTLGVPIPGTGNADKIRGTDKSEKIEGMGGDDSLFGFGGNDTLDGGPGNDLLVGGMGEDTLMGGADEDTISYNVSPAGVTINLTDGTARGGDADGDTIVDMGGDQVENVIGSAHDDVLTGNRHMNKLWGLGGNDELNGLREDDELYGGSGDDELDGGRGDDTLEGGIGADVLIGGDDDDTASYADSMMGVTVRLHNSRFMGGDAYGDSFGKDVTVEYTVTDEDNEVTEHEAMLPDIEWLRGSAYADVLAGDMRDNRIWGGDGDDMIYGGPSPMGSDLTNADMLYGQGGADKIYGGAGGDTLDGGAGNDTLVGGAGDDTYYGGAGSDMIYADPDDAMINGWIMTPPEDDPDTTGDGANESLESHRDNDPMAVDTVSYAMVDNEQDEGVTRTLNDPGVASPVVAGDTTILNVENIIGTQFVDTLTGNAGDNVIEGGDLGDTLVGGAGNDTVSYASSDDRVRVELADDGAEFNPTRGHASQDTVSQFENVTGSAHDDELEGNNLANVLKGGAGDDELTGDGGADTVEGGAGADEMDGGVNRSDTNEPGDTLSYASSDAAVTVNLTADNISLSGGHATDDIIATIETDHDGDSDRTDGEDPTDEVEVSTFENVTGSMHDDRLTGDYRDNQLTGGAGDDTLRGAASDPEDRTTELLIRGDVLVGGPGADMLDGGEDMGERDNMVMIPGESGVDDDGDGETDEEGEMQSVSASVDWAVYKHAMEGVTVNLATNMGTGGEADGDTLRHIELVWGSEKDDTFIAGPGADIIEGDGGSDTVSYEASETGVTVDLSDDAHHRTKTGVTGTGTEADPFVFPIDTDPTGETADQGTTHLDQAGVTAIPDPDDEETETNGAAGDKLGSIENLTGTAMVDSLTGDSNPNILKGMGGGDTLSGNGGNDTIYGGDGDDTIYGELATGDDTGRNRR